MPAEFHYELSWAGRGYRPGHHRGARSGGSQESIGHAPLLSAPDARRLDVRASLADPFGSWLVRTYQQRTSIPVYLVADLSASMGAGGIGKVHTLADFAASVAYSTYRTGDRYGCVAFDVAVRADFCLPLSFAKGAGLELAERLRALVPEGKSADGLLAVPDHLGTARALVFLVSDFHFPLALLERGLERLARHDVVPVVLWQEAEFAPLPRFGFTELRDAESGRRRVVLLRPSLQQRWRQAFARRREELTQRFSRYDRRPFFMTRGFSADALTDYFFSGLDNVA